MIHGAKKPDASLFDNMILQHGQFPQNKELGNSNCGWSSSQLVTNQVNLLIADIRYQILNQQVGQWRYQKKGLDFDRWLLKPWLGGFIFVIVMTLFFSLSIGIGGGLRKWCQALEWGLLIRCGQQSPMLNCVLVALLLCLSFWPILCVTYFLQSVLSESGYVQNGVQC